MHKYRFRLFPLGVLTGLFEPNALVEAVREGCRDGFRLIRREFTIEPRRFLFFFPVLAFGLVFRREEARPDAEFDYRVALYKTRFFTRTVDTRALERTLNEAAQDGYELFHAVKFPTRLLWIFPRESYTFVFRKAYAGPATAYAYRVFQTPYRFFSRTVDPDLYERDLNAAGQEGLLKITFRDERRLFGMFVQPTIVGIAEKQTAALGYAAAAA